MTRLYQPDGSPASASVSASSPAVSGVRSDGLWTTAQPAASAGATLCSTRFSGKLNGVIAATTPNGCGKVKPNGTTPLISSNCTVSDGSRRASSPATRSVVTARDTSTRAAAIGLPASARICSAKSSARSATSRLVSSSRSARAEAGHPASIAALAAVTASAACSGLATATVPTWLWSKGSCTAKVSTPSTQRPSRNSFWSRMGVSCRIGSLGMRPRTAAVNSSVPAVPPRSRVRTPSPSAASKAEISVRPASASPRCSSIMAAAHIWPTGFATPWPAMSGADPCTGSNIDGWSRGGLRLPLGATPIDPATAAARSERMSPNRLEATMTSRLRGLSTTRAARASTSILSSFTPPASPTTSATTSSQNGIVWMIPLDLVAEVRRPRRAWACATAYAATRETPVRVKTASCTAISSGRPR